MKVINSWSSALPTPALRGGKISVKMVHVVGGNITPRVKSWLDSLGIMDYVHVSLQTESIDPLELRKSALDMRQYLNGASALITVGKIADIILKLAYLDHGTLPAGNEERKEIIAEALFECNRYIEGKLYDRQYSILSGPPSGPKSS